MKCLLGSKLVFSVEMKKDKKKHKDGIASSTLQAKDAWVELEIGNRK